MCKTQVLSIFIAKSFKCGEQRLRIAERALCGVTDEGTGSRGSMFQIRLGYMSWKELVCGLRDWLIWVEVPDQLTIYEFKCHDALGTGRRDADELSGLRRHRR